MLSTKIGADATSEFLSSQESGWLDDSTFAMRPMRFNGIEPGTPGRQETGNDANAMALLPYFSIVRAYPTTHRSTDVPGSIVPDHEQSLLTSLFQLVATPYQVLYGDVTDWPAIYKTEPDLFWQGLWSRWTRN